jgi:hypothetical protein
MSLSAEIALVLLALSLAFGGLFWSGMASGESGFFRQFLKITRTGNPAAFWVGQTFFALLGTWCLGWSVWTIL